MRIFLASLMAVVLLSGCTLQCGSEGLPHRWGKWMNCTNLTEVQCLLQWNCYEVQSRECGRCGLKEIHPLR